MINGNSTQQISDPVISVVVCTFNRSGLLKWVLESLVEQTIEKEIYEIIVVDNNSIDDTANIAKMFMKSSPNLRYVKETAQGLSFARNRGYKEARGKYVAYIDDDARATPDWIERILDSFENVKPEPVAIGGEIHPWYEESPPAWFADDLEIRTWGDKKGFLQGRDAKYGFSGSNMSFRKSVLELYEGFSTDYGMDGHILRLGEETELFYRIYQDHPWFWYDPSIRVLHRVSVDNMTLSYRLRRSYQGGISFPYIKQGYHPVTTIIKTLLFVIFKGSILPFHVYWWQKDWQRNFLKHAEPIAACMGVLRQATRCLLNRGRSKQGNIKISII